MTTPMTTLNAFAKLVRDMRYAQRIYFETRTLASLDDARQLEREVDKAVRAVFPSARARGPLPGQRSFLDTQEDDA